MRFELFLRHKGTPRAEHAIYYHDQNLNEKRNGTKGGKWRHGRSWLHFFGNCLNFEWAFFWNSSTALGFTIGAEDDLKLHVAIWKLFSLWLSIDQIIPRNWRKNIKWWDKSWGRTTDIRIFDGSIWVNIHNDDTGWQNKRFWWQEFNINVVDFLKGKSKHSKTLMDSGETKLAFLEDTYSVKWEKWLHEWRFPRWFTQKLVRFDLNMDKKPIPVPGKGENSYDIDDDAIYSTSIAVSTLGEAIARLYQSVLNSRRRYGGNYEWIPNPSESKE